MAPDKQPEQRPELADFWDLRFRSGMTPWETQRVPTALREFVARHPAFAPADPAHVTSRSVPCRRRVLIPGCGSAHDAAFLDTLGWETIALDFSAAAIATARSTLGDGWRGQLLCADFFTFDPGKAFDVIYERAFLCSMPRQLRTNYAKRMAELLPPGGLLVGFFLFGDELRGPPFEILPQQLEDLLSARFSRREDHSVDDSLALFAGRERWQVWQRL